MGSLPFVFRLAWRQSRAAWRELLTLLLALVVGVGALVSVSAFTDRVGHGLQENAAAILGGDLAVRWDQPIPEIFLAQARRLGLQHAESAAFPSMVLAGHANLLAEVKAVSPGFPVRGSLDVRNAANQALTGIPAPGTLWVQPELLTRLHLQLGDKIELGNRTFFLSGIILKEPSRVANGFSLGPRVMLNISDLASTGLIQYGSRVTYQLYLGGGEGQIRQYHQWAKKHLALAMRVEGLENARPELRVNLDRANKFLGLAALTALTLAGIAIALSVQSFVVKRLDAVAVLRCLGARMSLILGIYLSQIMLLSLLGILLGIGLGYTLQSILPPLLAKFLPHRLPPPSLWPAAAGASMGLIAVFAFAMPPLLRLRRVPALRVLRRDLELQGRPDALSLGIYSLAALLFAALFIWQAGEIRLGIYVLFGSLATGLLLVLLAWGLLRMLARLRGWGGVSWRYGLANLARPGNHSLAQILAFGIALLALLSISVVQGDLFKAWENKIPPNAPNRFIINIMPGQPAGIARVMQGAGLPKPHFYPMVRGRLTAIDGVATAARHFKNKQDQSLAMREFNLSWAVTPQADNRVVKGRWWKAADAGKPYFSVESDIARALNIHVGSRLSYNVAGQAFTGTVRNIRKVDWDTFQVNFFVLMPPGLLEGMPRSYVTSFYLPPDKTEVSTQLVAQAPNITLVDVGAIMAQIRDMLTQVRQVLGFVFVFTLAAGFVVLLAAIQASRIQRERDAAVLRALGATAAQMRKSAFAEFALIGLVAGGIASLGAQGLAAWLSREVFDLPFHLNPWLWFWGPALGALGIGTAGVLGLRKVLATSPLQVLRQ